MMKGNPIKWTSQRLERLPDWKLDRLARRAAGVLAQSRLLVGRCLLAIDRSQMYERYGCSCMVHYACLSMGLSAQEARELRRVAERLENLPLLTEACENGSVEWCALREITRQAQPETEAYWLEMARTCTMRRLERLLRQAGGGGSSREAELVELRLMLQPEVSAMFGRALRRYSQEAGRRLSAREVFEYLLADSLAGDKQEAALDVAAEEEAPWAALAAQETDCPGNSALQLVAPAAPHWSNDRLKFNAEARLASPAQRREILRRDGYRCSTPDCPHILWLQVHHIVFHHRGGPTVPRNMCLVCSACHAQVHRGRLQIAGQAPGELEWRDGAGRLLKRFVPLEPVDWLRCWFASG